MNVLRRDHARMPRSPRSYFWRARYARWGRRPGAGTTSGYSLVLPVPGDLPVFLELALAVCRLQDPTSRLETLVVPDLCTPEMRAIVEANAPDWPGRLELLPLPALDRLVLPRLGDPSRNHGAQLIRGVTRARGSHVILHDADLFMMDPDAHSQEFELALVGNLDVVGVSPAWDPWFAGHGRELVATWEQCGRVSWYRSFPPHRHMGHDAVAHGELHTFDNTFWPQLNTPQAQLSVGAGLADRIVHFNYTIGTYRRYRRRRDSFRDTEFRILLIRMFVERGQPSRDGAVRAGGRQDLPADAGQARPGGRGPLVRPVPRGPLPGAARHLRRPLQRAPPPLTLRGDHANAPP